MALLLCGAAVFIGLSWLFSEDGLNSFLRAMEPAGAYEDYAYELEDSSGSRAALWTGDGEYAVAQVYSADGTPCVVAVDPDGGEPILQEGYLLAAVEPTGSVVWVIHLEPTWAEEPLSLGYPAPIVADGMFDGPLKHPLDRWDIGGAYPEPVGAQYASWQPLVSSTGVRALFEIDDTRGGNPAALSIEQPGGPAVEVPLPPEILTFHAIGWSPSGRYFALEQLTQVSSIDSPDTYSYDYYDGPKRFLVIVDARTARPVFERQVMNDGLGPAFWHAERDVVVWGDQQAYADERTGEESAPARLMAAAPSGEMTRADVMLGFEEPVAWGDLSQLALLGCEPSGMLVTAPWAGTPMWLIGKDGVQGAGSADDVYGGAWSERWGVLSVGAYTDPATSAQLDALRLYDVSGGPRRDLWLADPPTDESE